MARLQDLQRELAQQARAAYRYWPLFLVRRVRQLERHVNGQVVTVIPPSTSAPVPSSARWVTEADVAVLRESGLPLPDELPRAMMPERMRLPAAEQCWFHAGPLPGVEGLYTLNLLRQETGQPTQSAEPRCFRLELMRVEAHVGWYLEDAARSLERMAEQLGYEVSLQAARIWSVLHGGEPQAWTPVSVDDMPSYSPTEATANQETLARRTPKHQPAQDSANMWDFLNSAG